MFFFRGGTLTSATTGTTKKTKSTNDGAIAAMIEELIRNALILAKQRDFDLFNALDIMDNDNKSLMDS